MAAQPIGAAAGGYKDGGAFFDDFLPARVFELQDALQQQDRVEAVAAREQMNAPVQRHMVGGEMLAGGEALHCVFREKGLGRRQYETRRRRHVQDVERAIDLEFPRLAVAVRTSIIVETVGRVGVLLDFRQRDARAHRVQRAGLNQVDVAGTGGYAIADFEERTVLDALAEFHLCHAAVDAVNQRRPRLRLYHVPELGLAPLVFFPERVLVIGVNLDRKVLRRVDQLDQEREIYDARRVGACYSVAFHRDIARKLHAGRRAVLNHTAAVFTAGEFPAFRHRRQARFLMIFFLEFRAAPEVILQRWNQLQRIQQDVPLPFFLYIGIYYTLLEGKRL